MASAAAAIYARRDHRESGRKRGERSSCVGLAGTRTYCNMARVVKRVQRNAVFAWSPNPVQDELLATATAAGGIGDSFDATCTRVEVIEVVVLVAFVTDKISVLGIDNG